MTSAPSTIKCINLLVEGIPELRSAFDKHIRDNDKLLPHVFLGDVARYVVQQLRSSGAEPAVPVKRVFDVLDQCIASGDESVKEMIFVSFIENLADHEEVFAGLKSLFGPNLRWELERYP